MADALIYLKIHATENGKLIAMCDESLIDKILQEGEMVIDIKNYSDFYKGELIHSKSFNDIVSAHDILSANIVGKESVEAAITNKVIERGHVKRISGIPYAHAYRID